MNTESTDGVRLAIAVARLFQALKANPKTLAAVKRPLSVQNAMADLVAECDAVLKDATPEQISKAQDIESV